MNERIQKLRDHFSNLANPDLRAQYMGFMDALSEMDDKEKEYWVGWWEKQVELSDT